MIATLRKFIIDVLKFRAAHVAEVPLCCNATSGEPSGLQAAFEDLDRALDGAELAVGKPRELGFEV
jgi:hypothetical protein